MGGKYGYPYRQNYPRWGNSFHDAILLGGSMPLTVLETYLDLWAVGEAVEKQAWGFNQL